MSYGERLVGLTFNPSGDAKVEKLKRLFAEIVDICHDSHTELTADGNEQRELYREAEKHALTAQMWAVKAATWRY